MKAFTVFMFLPASATADGVLSHESILWFHGSSSISTADGVVSYGKIFPLHFNENSFYKICFPF